MPTTSRPQDNTQPLPEAPDTATTRYLLMPVNRRVLAVLAFSLVLALLPGWLLLWGGSNTPDSGEHVQATAAASAPGRMLCSNNQKSYVNAYLSLGFCYPYTWGEVIVHEGKFGPPDNGSRWRLSFTEKAPVTVGLVSPDWSTTMPRSASCADPAVQTLPSFASFPAVWQTEGTPAVRASRGIEKRDGAYIIEERVADDTTNGVCLTGDIIIGGPFRHVTATYYAEFNPVITSPARHIANPTTLITTADRVNFAAFFKTIKRL
jgi:hypothetical protein